MAPTLSQQLAIEQRGPGEYVSTALPERMGNAMPIAYGGCTLGVATAAACASVPPSHSLYSIVGHYLGPASTKEKLLCTVHATRDTKTFATRRVEVKQTQPDGKVRTCMELLADFHAEEPASLLSYSAPPTRPYPAPEENPTLMALQESFVARGLVDKATVEMIGAQFGMMERFFHARLCPDGMAGQTLHGVLKSLPTTQDGLPVTARSSGDWVKTRAPLSSAQEKMAALSFLMDGGIAFIPLTHSHLWFDDAGACSTLDFALRILTPNVDLSSWHLRERTTSAADAGRTYSEGRLWDEQGNLVASMTQVSILRPKPASKSKASL